MHTQDSSLDTKSGGLRPDDSWIGWSMGYLQKIVFMPPQPPPSPTSRLTSQTPLETSPEDLLMGPLFLGDGQDPGFVGEDSLQGSEGLAAPTPTPPGQEWDAWVVFLHLFPVSLWLLSLISG